jgi:hypothetical protein
MALASGGAFGIWHQGDMKNEMEKVKKMFNNISLQDLIIRI